jgi:cystathionine beta-lyase/cystathionine gamma-synthase
VNVKKMRFSTQQIHAGVEPDPTTGAILTPIYQSTTYVQPSVDEYLAKGYSYSRSGNPTVRVLEQKLATLEGGADATCFSTGMAAIHAVMLAFLNAGEHAVVSDVAYGGTYRICTKVFSRFGVEFTFADTSKPDEVRAALRDNTRLILTETPANPTLKLTDIAAISEIARQRSIPHAVDNTFLTPYYQRPLELGADLIVHSTTKYLDGHNATVGGAVVAGTAEHDEAVRFIQNSTGTILSPQVAWLTLQGCKTLSVRMDRQCENSMSIARFLESHAKVERVCYRLGLRRDGLVRGQRRRRRGQAADGLGQAVDLGREPRFGRVTGDASGHDDPRRRGRGRAQTRGHHRRLGTALGGTGGRRGSDPGSRTGTGQDLSSLVLRGLFSRRC